MTGFATTGSSSFPTRTIHAGRSPDPHSAALGAPIVQATAYAHDAVGVNRGHAYSRVSNPTVDALERALGAIEDAPPAVAFRSGCAAIAAVFLTLLRPGDEVIVSDVVYGGTVRLLRELLAELGVTPRFVDTSDLGAMRAALGPSTRLVLVETPGNPTLKLSDVGAVAAICRAAGVPLAVDNTFLTPIVLRPLDLGADIAIYSTTKYQDGHGVSVGGAVLARDEALLARFRRTRKTLGSIQAPHEAWLTLQGLRTLDLRVRRHFENALQVATGLAARPWVRTVTYPGLPSFPQRELAAALPAHGGVVVLEIDGGPGITKAFLEELRLVRLAEHLGSIETLATHPATMSHGDVPRAQRELVGITDELVRLSVGLEDPQDILRDLDEAHGRAARRIAAANATVVLKFGSSVLRSTDDLPTAVHEIYRAVAGRRVVAVVSAIGDATDRLLATARAVGDADDATTASLLATGEAAAAALLGAALGRAGIPATVLDATTLALRTEGPTLDAHLVALDAKPLHAALDAGAVVVVPGFVGRDAVDGRTTLLGRGGSDLTAAFLAARLGAAECVLLKDVDGVYTSDPAHEGSAPPRRYETISPDDARRIAGPLVQPKAIDLAATAGLPLAIRRVGEREGTVIRAGASRLAEIRRVGRPAVRGESASTARASRVSQIKEPPRSRIPRNLRQAAATQRCGILLDRSPNDFRHGLLGDADHAGRGTGPLRVAVLGAGIVGGGVISRLLALPGLFSLQSVLVRDRTKVAALRLPEGVAVERFDEALDRKPDVVVELVGGVHPARGWIERALDAGISVVTANKALLAGDGGEAGAALRDRAARGGAELRIGGAVGGAAPVVEALGAASVVGVRSIEAALSGTCNSVLERVAQGWTWDAAVASAQALGLAERDPRRDLEGRDLADKLLLLARIAWPHARLSDLEADFAASPDSPEGSARGILGIDVDRIRRAARSGDRWLLVGRLDLATARPDAEVAGRAAGRDEFASRSPAPAQAFGPALGPVRGSLRIERFSPDHPFAALRGSEVSLRWVDGSGFHRTIRGGGAGRWPTTEAVIGDLLELRAQRRDARRTVPAALAEAGIAP
ncbi:MAG: aminotransferase class I/II-fold pyridoxal phosphate-dependent enzyme [Phycisphaerales bacterium]